jgi:membrane-bound serine protease (ClpP class)
VTTQKECSKLAILLPAYVDHELTEAELASVEQHVHGCAACAEHVRHYQRTIPRLDAGIRAVLEVAPTRVSEQRRARGLLKHGVVEDTDFGARNLASRALGAAVLAAVCLAALVVLMRTAPPPLPDTETAAQPLVATGTGTSVVLAAVSGVVDPAVESYVRRALADAEERQVPLVLTLDTPGGQQSAIRAISASLANSRVPTATYVWPAGARAGGGADAIASAANVAAIAPASSLPGTSDALTAENLASLLHMLDGRAVQTPLGPAILRTAGATVHTVEMSFWELLAHRLFDPTVAYLLFVLGLFAVLLELAHPGGLVLGAMGALSSGIGLVAFATALPVNWLGVALLVLAMGLCGIEINWPTHGFALLISAGCLIGGSVLLYMPLGIGTLPPAVLVAMAAGGLVLGLWAARAAAAVRNLPALDALNELHGALGTTRTALDPEGVVYVAGALWSARLLAGQLEPGEPVRVLARRGLVLEVESARFRSAATQKGALR